MATEFVFSWNSMNAATEIHAAGCQAAGRKVKGYPSKVSTYTVDAEYIQKMQANPDEGSLKIHSCAKPTLQQA